METNEKLNTLQKPVMMLNEGNFGLWKTRRMYIICGIDEDAWTAVESWWTAPSMMMEGKTLAPKPKERWTEFDKAASNFNSKDLTTIFSAVDLDQFKIIQGCKSANWKTSSGLIICLEYGAVCSNTSLGFGSKTWEHECNWNQVDFKNKTDEMEMWSEINQD